MKVLAKLPLHTKFQVRPRMCVGGISFWNNFSRIDESLVWAREHWNQKLFSMKWILYLWSYWRWIDFFENSLPVMTSGLWLIFRSYRFMSHVWLKHTTYGYHMNQNLKANSLQKKVVYIIVCSNGFFDGSLCRIKGIERLLPTAYATVPIFWIIF